MLEILSTVIEKPLIKQMRASQVISLELDESTDVSLLRQLDLHLRYLDEEGLVFTQFLDIVTVSDGKADTIVTTVKDVLQKKQVPTEKLCGLGTGGAAVMTGRVNGVAKQLTDSFPMIVAVACAAHRLALACKDASNQTETNTRHEVQYKCFLLVTDAKSKELCESGAARVGESVIYGLKVPSCRLLAAKSENTL
ncbi:hypothetical protein ABVT39_024011 [Epinephelus coioides]